MKSGGCTYLAYDSVRLLTPDAESGDFTNNSGYTGDFTALRQQLGFGKGTALATIKDVRYVEDPV